MIGVASINTSCKKDDDNTITLKGSGIHKLNVVNGTTPASGANVILYNSKTQNILSTARTDNAGNVDFGNLIEGNYSAVIEVNEPQYAKVTQEFQVISGQTNESKIQVKDHTGNITLAMVLRNNSESLIKEDFGMGIALIPVNDNYRKAKTLEEKFALKSALKYPGSEGKVNFTDIQTGEYALYKVYNDKLVERVDYYNNYTVTRGGNAFNRVYINLSFEKAFAKASWSFKDAKRVSNSYEYPDYPIESFSITKDNNNESYYNLNFVLKNGAEITSRANYFYEYSGWTECYTYNRETNKRFSTDMPNYLYFRFNAEGELQFRISYLSIYDQLKNSHYFYLHENHVVTFE